MEPRGSLEPGVRGLPSNWRSCRKTDLVDEIIRGSSFRKMELKGRTWQGEGLGVGGWKIQNRKTKGRDELTDEREAVKESQGVGCGIRRTTGWRW